MLKVAVKGLAARKRRAFTLVVAVFLGVALTSGAYVLTDTINASFEDIFESSIEGTDVSITSREIVSQEDQEPPPLDASLLERVERVPGVDKAEGSIFAMGRIVDEDGDSIGAQFAPSRSIR
jgi:putative ABC transport system permease protein